MKVYLNTEIARREVLGNLLLAALLAVRGHYAVLIHQEDTFALRAASKRRGVVFHTKSLNYSSGWISLHSALHEIGFIITSHDQEGSGPTNMRNFVASRYCSKNLEIAEAVFAWTEDERKWIEELFPFFSERVYLTGSPRVDVWQNTFRGFGDHLRRDSPYILLTPSIPINVEPQYWKMFDGAMSTGYFGQNSDRQAEEVMQEILDSLASQIPFCRIALKMLREFPSHRLVIRPRPDESKEAWTTMLRVLGASRDELVRIQITHDGPLEEWIHGASLVINATSTAGFNALVSEVPVIVFGESQTAFGRIGRRCESEDEVVSASLEALEDPKKFVKSYSGVGRGLTFQRADKTKYLAADKIIARWLKHSHGHEDSRLGIEDFLLWFEPGLVRRGIRNFLNLLSGKPRITIPDASVVTITRDEVSRQLKVISEALGIEEDIRFQIRGRRNVVVFPV